MSLGVHGEGAARHRSERSAPEPASQLSIQVNDDRLTMAVAKVPQVYLFGPIDAGAPARFEKLTASRKVPPGSDIYLNSPGGDLAAGLALGRMFRAGSMVTHLGVPRRGPHVNPGSKVSVCVNACVYAYVGGLYRWAPAGNDRLGLQASASTGNAPNAAGKSPPASGELAAYLRDMGIQADTFASLASSSEMVWLTLDQLGALDMVNNGYLPLTASHQLVSGAPKLVLDQLVRGGEHKVELLCRPDGLTITTYDNMGGDHARQVVPRATRSYFEIDHQALQPEPRQRASVFGSAVMSSGSLTLEQLQQLVSAHSFGSWLSDRNGAVRYGFTIAPNLVRSDLESYYAQCRQMMQPAAGVR